MCVSFPLRRLHAYRFPYAEAHGDHAAEFCFAAMFPRPMRPFVACPSELVYNVSKLLVPGFVTLREVDASVGAPIMYDPAQADGPSAADAATLGAFGGPSFGLSGLAGDLTAGAVSAVAGASEEYNARRAKALALLDENFSSLLGATGKTSHSKRDGEKGLSPRADCLDSSLDGLEAPPPDLDNDL
eukprot:TRINITY_DN11617_c1_g1_i2.p1 TRINITY_DN11617_c1_g1~~TRINITY_DN11617_c1_g1_i2.p1  ORF type:complete len:193 (+),score=32.00 TRINITY_DN11617_c1_g1_i2:24-581(+)